MVDAATRAVRHMRMTEQVLFTSFSPAMLELARLRAPEIGRILAVIALQFLSAGEIEAMFDTTVTLIDKDHDLGLQWAEVGTFFRLPGYRSPDELIAAALALDARVVEADYVLLKTTGPALVSALHGLDVKVFGFTVNRPDEWAFLESLDVDGIYTNDISLGLHEQAPIP